MPETITVESSYKGPHLQSPITKSHFESLVLSFQRGDVSMLE